MFGGGAYEGYEGGGGGFDTSGFGTSDTPQGDKKGPKRSEHLVAVTVRQVIQSADTGLKIGSSGSEASMVKLVGIIKKINVSSIKVIYTLEDNTGSIEGIHWMENDGNDDNNFVIPVVENTYCTMIGSIRNMGSQHNAMHIMVFHIAPVTDLNDITAHTLQIIYTAYKSEDLSQQTQPYTNPTGGGMAAYDGMNSSLSNTGNDYAAGFNLNPQQQKVLTAVAQNCNSELGASVNDVMKALTVKIPLKEVEKIIEFLLLEGHIYSTSDDKHYKSTDA